MRYRRGEENILEDVLHYAYTNKCPVYMSFHLDWWKHKKITDFDYLFQRFTVANLQVDNISPFLKTHPFASLLLIPKEEDVPLVKENITAVIIGYNQLTYIKNMVSQLEKYTKDIVILDNQSDYQPLLDYFQNEYPYTVLRQKANFGYIIYMHDWVKTLTGDIYILTDPDLQFNPQLPEGCISQLIELSNYFQANKVGFALLIDAEDIRTDVNFYGHSIKQWESQFWIHRLLFPLNQSLELYSAPIDTTFCLVNRKYYQSDRSHSDQKCIRVAGDYTCVHIPWHVNFQNDLPKDEYEAYLRNNVSTNFFKVQ